MSGLRHLAPPLVAIAAAVAARGQSPSPAPIPTDLKESIEVRLVTIDVIALDGDERTVPDLGKDDFELYVDGKPSQIDTLDQYCEGGAQDDPKSKTFGGWPAPKDLAEGERRIVLAFDYLHLPSTPCPDMPGPCFYHTKSLQAYQDVLESKSGIADEEIMVVALTGGLRVEQPFTRDRRAVIDTLRRMEHDVSLFGGNFDHLTERPLFAGLDALITVLHTTRGPKAVVFISAGAGPGDSYQLQFDRLAATASDAQVSLYPVDCQGVYAKTSYT